jgi:hypothetical protein
MKIAMAQNQWLLMANPVDANFNDRSANNRLVTVPPHVFPTVNVTAKNKINSAVG